MRTSQNRASDQRLHKCSDLFADKIKGARAQKRLGHFQEQVTPELSHRQMNSRLRGKQHKSPLVGSGLYCESTLGASVPTAVCFTCFSRTFSHLTILTLKITTRECRQIAEQSPHRALSFWISLLCFFLLWELLGDVVVGGRARS